MIKRTIQFLLAAVLLATALASCGSDATSTATDDAAQQPVADDPVADSSVAGEPVADEPDADEPVADEPDAGDAAADEPDADEPASDDHDDADHGHDGETDYLGSYTLVDETFGTMVTVTVDGDTRSIASNSLPDHDTGSFPTSGNPNTISEQSLTLEYPATPAYTGNASFAQQPGIAINGVPFEPGTAESVTCASGETYRIEGLQDLYNLGMDFNNAHVQPTGKYHYHGIAELLVDNHDHGDDLVLIGFAADGFLMYYSQSGAFASSYELSTAARSGSDCVASGPAGGDAVAIDGSTPDGTYNTDWTYVDGGGDLDSCNGIEIDEVYAYVVTDEYPFVPRCLNGEFTATGPGAGGPPAAGQGGGQGGAPPGGGGGAAPDFAEAAAQLGVTEEALVAALGDPPPDLAAAAEALGITQEELEAVMPPPPGQ